MWKLRLDSVDPVVGSAAAAVLCTILAQHLFSRDAELCSETLSWIILPILFRFASRLHATTTPITSLSSTPGAQSAFSLWIFAVSLVVSCLYKAEFGVIDVFPALTPLLLIAQRYLQSESSIARTSHSWFFSPLVSTVWGTALAASFFILALTASSSWDLRQFAPSAVPVAALLLVYVSLLPKAVGRSRFIPHVDIENAIVPLSWRVAAVLVVVLGMHTAVFGLTIPKIVPMLLLSLAKASSWYFIIQTTRNASWCIATTMGTFGLMSTRDPFVQWSEAQAISHVIASFLALGQVVHMLPKQVRARSWLWAFSLIALAPYLANIFAIRTAQSAYLGFRHSIRHPVETLVDNARAAFEDMLQKQSKNYTAAENEYRRRYSAEPPPGFQAWYEFAVSHQSPIIDEFDLIYDAISPFWRLNGSDVLKIMGVAQLSSDMDVWHCVFSNNHTKTQCTHPSRSSDRNVGFLFGKLLGDLPISLTNVDFFVNHLDEPRVLIPPPSFEDKEYYRNGLFNEANMALRPVWSAVTKFCGARQRNGSVKTGHTLEEFSLPFVTDRTSAMDLCQHSEYSTMHGLVMNPASFRLVEGPVPILTTGSLSTMGDILFPSPAYIEASFRYDAASDIEWDRKHNNLYWAGSTTGGVASDERWPQYHRQRFVALAQNLERQQHYYLRENGGMIQRVESSFLNSRLFDVAFTWILQCDRKYCRKEKAYFRVKAWANKDQALQSRLVFDMDGNGISGRYYKLLASKSAPLKQTLLREWHDDRLIPWLHYIPVSQGMGEVPELVFYLTSTESGQQKAKEIAEQGRDWFSKAFREIDLSIYTYRLLLELARIQDPKRQAS